MRRRNPDTRGQIAGEKIGARTNFNAEKDVLRLLAERRQCLALAESCTGGCLADRLTNVPGASAVFLGGVVAYSNAVKKKFLGVRAETLAAHGAVSRAVACEMAEGARKKFKADFAIAITGIAGPSGGTKAKPVGTVFLALAGDFGTMFERRWNPYPRRKFKQVTARQALAILHSKLAKSGTVCA
jgi:nicotinamide-nucleotide amidase